MVYWAFVVERPTKSCRHCCWLISDNDNRLLWWTSRSTCLCIGTYSQLLLRNIFFSIIINSLPFDGAACWFHFFHQALLDTLGFFCHENPATIVPITIPKQMSPWLSNQFELPIISFEDEIGFSTTTGHTCVWAIAAARGQLGTQMQSSRQNIVISRASPLPALKHIHGKIMNLLKTGKRGYSKKAIPHSTPTVNNSSLSITIMIPQHCKQISVKGRSYFHNPVLFFITTRPSVKYPLNFSLL